MNTKFKNPSLFFLAILLLSLVESCSSASEKKFLPKNIIVKNQEEHEVTLASIIKGRKVMILRLPQNNCSSCVELFLPDVKRLAQKLKERDLIVLTAFSQFRDFIVFKENNFATTACFNIQSLGIDEEKSNSSYFFVLEPDTFETKSFFSPTIQQPKLTQQYMSEQSKSLFNTEVKFY